MEDIRWKQRFFNYQKAFGQLSRFMQKENPSEMEMQGLIKAFEYTFELAWKTLQDYLEEKSGYPDIKGPRPVIIKSFQDGILSHGETWMEMLKDRNRTVHTYDEQIAIEIVHAITQDYFPLLRELEARLLLFLS